MKICGIIAEYNPFHQGHIYQLQSIQNQFDAIVVILSAYYSQRGLPSLLKPNDKANFALTYGANLVCQLPAHFTCQSAEYFAKYAIESLSYLGIDSLCFGSECHSLTQLEEWNDLIQSKKVKPNLSLHQTLPERIQANDLLGLHYLQECKKNGIQAIPIARNPNFESATSIRNAFFNGERKQFDAYFHQEQNWQNYYPYLQTFLLLSSASDLSSYFLVNEGIEYRLKKAANNPDWDSFLQAAISKTYTKARIQRTCLMILLQIKKSEMKNLHFNEVQVLGFDSIGQKILKQNKNKKIITKFHQLSAFEQTIESKTLTLYNSVMKNKIQREEVLHP